MTETPLNEDAHDTYDGFAHPLFPHLFSPIRLGSVRLRNRVVLSPMGSRFAKDGGPTAGDVAFYKARAEAGVGLIITGGTLVHPRATLRGRGALEAFNDSCLPAFATFAKAVKSTGAGLVGQLFHRGRETLGESDWPTWAPSPIAAHYDTQVPHEMTLQEIDEVVEGFARSARNLMLAGYDGIEIHGAHGYLVAQFLSVHANQRTDHYGGSDENRSRFLMRVIEAIREQIGAEAPLGVRISAEEGPELEDGIHVDQSKRIAQALAKSGQVTYISVSMGVRGTYVKDMSVPVGPTVDWAHAIKAASGLPVIVGQRINHPPLAERVLSEGKADLIGMARPLIADAEWVRKARERRLEEIRPCVACNQVCRSGVMGCVHNPEAGRELIWPQGSLMRAEAKRKIVVVGGGPAGMEAAIQATRRGHQVVLFETQPYLGGQVRIAAQAPHRTEIDGVVGWRIAELQRLGVELRLNTRASPTSVLSEGPSAVVLATGAIPAVSTVEGSHLPHVIDVFRALDADAATRRLLDTARSAVVVDDGSGFWETCSVAEALAARGISVSYLSPTRTFAESLPFEAALPLLQRLRSLEVALFPMHRVAWIEPETTTAFDVMTGTARGLLQEIALPADLVVYYAGKKAVDELAMPLRQSGVELHLVGDCMAPRRINNATLEAHTVGRRL